MSIILNSKYIAALGYLSVSSLNSKLLLSELLDQLVRVLLPGMCRAEHTGFEPRFNQHMSPRTVSVLLSSLLLLHLSIKIK